MEVCGIEADGGHFCIGDDNALWVGVGVEPALDGEARTGRRCGDELDDDLMADEGLATPILGDEGKQAMLDLVPFAGAGRR
jgi:hypothetical protein